MACKSVWCLNNISLHGVLLNGLQEYAVLE